MINQLKKRIVELQKSRKKALEEIGRAKGMIMQLETIVIGNEATIREFTEEIKKFDETEKKKKEKK